MLLNNKVVQSSYLGREKVFLKSRFYFDKRSILLGLQDTFSLPELFFYFLIKKICKVRLFLYNAATYHKMFS